MINGYRNKWIVGSGQWVALNHKCYTLHTNNYTLLCVSLIFIFHFSFFNSLYGQEVRYQSDSSCGCDILYVDGFETLRDGDLYGFRRYDGKVIVPPTYKYVSTFRNGYCQVWMDDTLAGLIDTSGREILPPHYDFVAPPSENRILFAKNNLYGYADLRGNIVVPPRFPQAGSFQEHRAPVAVVVDSAFLLCTFIDTFGNFLFEPIYENVMPFSGGVAPVRRYDRWGLIDTLGNEILTTRFEQLSTPDHGTFFAGDENGMVLYKVIKTSSHQDFKSQNLEVLKSRSLEVSPVTPPHYLPYTTVADGRIGVTRVTTGKQGFLDLDGREVIPCTYDEIGRFVQGRTMVRIDDRYGIIDTLGGIVLPIEYQNLVNSGEKYLYHDGLALVEKDSLLGFIDLDGKPVTERLFSRAYAFSDGLAAVCLDGRWGYIDTLGQPFLPFIFDLAAPFKYQRAEVWFNNQRYTIDTQGRCVKNCNGIISFR